MRCIWSLVNPINALFVYPRQFKELRKTEMIGLFNLNVFICNLAVKIVSLETKLQSLNVGTLVVDRSYLLKASPFKVTRT